MTLQEYMKPFEETYKKMTRKEKLQFLKSFFLNFLVEDPRDGTPFDCDVMKAIEELGNCIERYEK